MITLIKDLYYKNILFNCFTIYYKNIHQIFIKYSFYEYEYEYF